MVSVITPVYATNRVESVKRIFGELKELAGVPTQHIIVVDGNPETYKMLYGYGDNLILLPRNIEWNRALNIGEKFAKYKYIASFDDDARIGCNDFFKRAVEIYEEEFPEGGVLGFSNGEQNCAQWMTTREYAYKENLNNFVWPEYWHNGDTETCQKAKLKGQYYWSPELSLTDPKHEDEGRQKSLLCYTFDDPLFEYRQAHGFPNMLTDQQFPTNERIKELERNYLNE